MRSFTVAFLWLSMIVLINSNGTISLSIFTSCSERNNSFDWMRLFHANRNCNETNIHHPVSNFCDHIGHRASNRPRPNRRIWWHWLFPRHRLAQRVTGWRQHFMTRSVRCCPKICQRSVRCCCCWCWQFANWFCCIPPRRALCAQLIIFAPRLEMDARFYLRWFFYGLVFLGSTDHLKGNANIEKPISLFHRTKSHFAERIFCSILLSLIFKNFWRKTFRAKLK